MSLRVVPVHAGQHRRHGRGRRRQLARQRQRLKPLVKPLVPERQAVEVVQLEVLQDASVGGGVVPLPVRGVRRQPVKELARSLC